VFACGGFSLWLLAQAPAWLRRLATAALGRVPGQRAGRVAAGARSFAEGLAVLRRGRLLSECLALSLAAWLVGAAMYYLIGVAFQLPIGFVAAFLGLAAANLATMIPAAPGYVGTFDTPLVEMMKGMAGLSPEAALGYTLVVHAALVVPVVVLGLL